MTHGTLGACRAPTRRVAALSLAMLALPAPLAQARKDPPPPPEPQPAAPQRFLGAAMRYSADRGGVSFVAVRNGVVLAEDYPNGGAAGAMNPIGAGAQGYAGALAALLARQRLLNIDEPVALSLGGWGADPLKSSVTVRQLLSMTSGLKASEDPPETLNEAMSVRSDAAAGERFAPNAAGLVVFCEIVRRKLLSASVADYDPARYLEQGLLNHIGAFPVRWARTADGLPRFDGGAALTARAWAAFGEFLRRDGVWRARMLVSARVLESCFEGVPASGGRYGLGFWLASSAPAPADFSAPDGMDIWGVGAPYDLAIAAGQSGQRLYVVPSRRVVIARQASAHASDWSDAAFLRLALAEL